MRKEFILGEGLSDMYNGVFNMVTGVAISLFAVATSHRVEFKHYSNKREVEE